LPVASGPAQPPGIAKTWHQVTTADRIAGRGWQSRDGWRAAILPRMTMNRGRFRTPAPEIRRASTILFDSVADLRETLDAMHAGDRTMSVYGLLGTPTTLALEEILLAGEGGDGVAFSPTGMSAISVAFLAVARTGDHVLVTDSVYSPARRLCELLLRPLGIDVEFYDPLIGAGISELIRANTSLIWMESPGTHTFEIQDVPAIVAAARAADHPIVTAFDNTWGSPGVFRPFEHGVDISVVALTKYWGGHSDLLMGATFAIAELVPRVHEAAELLGMSANAEDTFLVVRGSRTAEMRIRASEAGALDIARRLERHPRAGRVLHPALPSHPGHDIWQRDFHGSSGLFAFELLGADGEPAGGELVDAFTDRLISRGRFGLGYSWGGYESLVMPHRMSRSARDVRPWTGGELIRLHIGIEPVDELWADLEAAFEAKA
jgi:cystathionine beta-lyase